MNHGLFALKQKHLCAGYALKLKLTKDHHGYSQNYENRTHLKQ